MKIAIGSDHAGYRLKLAVIRHLIDRRLDFVDVGCNSTDSCDYPQYAIAVAEQVARGDCDLGLLFCGTGIGMSMAANKVKGIRAAACSDTFSARATREHNNANILCMGERVVGEGLAVMLVEAFLNAEFQGGKHQRRIDQFMALENQE
ncbi:MAG: ribose 5-phosphate isomerase B [Clostridia bacterium]|nr:ribose 5-phosphate isomerase B [Clostridia bacterium]MBQ3076774.1 ribose 5-phosphate isomerase B [Clostridia bacterium]